MTGPIHRAGFWIRGLALLIDAIFLLVIYILLVLLQEVLRRSSVPADASVVLLQICASASYLLYTATEIAFAGTPGKLILGLRIANQDGTPPPRAKLVSRWTAKWSFLILNILGDSMHQTLIWWLGSLMFYIVAIGCLPAAGDSKLAWHDSWAGTAVIRKPKRAGRQRGFEPVFTPQLQRSES